MNIKLIIALVVIVVLVVLGFVFFGGKGEIKKDVVTDTSKNSSLVDGTYKIATDRTVSEWEGKKVLIDGYRDNGTIKMKEGLLIVKDGKLSSGNVVIDMDSIIAISTGIGSGQEGLTKHLKSKDFFDTSVYPTSTFTVKEDATGNNVTGELLLKGKTNAVTFPVELSMENGELRLKGVAVLDRTKWGIVYGSGSFFDNLKNNVIDDNFTVVFDLVATK